MHINKISSIDKNYDLRNKQNLPFKMEVIVCDRAKTAINPFYTDMFDSVMTKFKDVVKDWWPKNCPLYIDSFERANESWETSYYRGIPSTKIHKLPYKHNPQMYNGKKENLCLVLNGNKCGFLFNTDRSEQQIINDLKNCFRDMRAHSGLFRSYHCDDISE